MQQLNGLSYHSNAFDENFETKLIECINSLPWDRSLNRLTQHYGAKRYSYNKSIKKTEDLPDAPTIPAQFQNLLQLLYRDGILDEAKEPLDQCIVNRYLPGEGISFHTDHQIFFDEPIISISLGSNCVMEFKQNWNSATILPIQLERRSVLVLRGDARWKAVHGIKSQKIDNYPQIDIKNQIRETRYSITFRKMKKST